MSFFSPPPTPSSPEHVWLDVDPGHDDFFAILLAASAPSLHILGISTVAGNQTIEKTTQNTLNCLYSIGKENIPVYQGRHEPLMKISSICEEIHGETGLNGAYFPSHSLAIRAERALEAMYKAVLPFLPPSFTLSPSTSPSLPFTDPNVSCGNANGLTIIATGPLTNVALLLLSHPISKQGIKRIVLMGGSYSVGNMSPMAEFNILVDPDAAKIVFDSGLPIVCCPLEVTHTLLAEKRILNRINRINSNFSTTLINLLVFFTHTYKTIFDFDHPPLHDICTILYILYPDIFEGKLMNVAVDNNAYSLTNGQTVCDYYNLLKGKRKNCFMLTKMNVERGWDYIIEAIKKADESSPLNALDKSLFISKYNGNEDESEAREEKLNPSERLLSHQLGSINRTQQQ